MLLAKVKHDPKMSWLDTVAHCATQKPPTPTTMGTHWPRPRHRHRQRQWQKRPGEGERRGAKTATRRGALAIILCCHRHSHVKDVATHFCAVFCSVFAFCFLFFVLSLSSSSTSSLRFCFVLVWLGFFPRAPLAFLFSVPYFYLAPLPPLAALRA